MKEFRNILIATAVCAACAALPAEADEDFALTYRGRITAQREMPPELEVTYSLYVGEEDDDASYVWRQTKTEHPAANGAFQSVLSGDGLQAAFKDRKARFLGIQLGTNRVEQYPRQEILAVPLAEYADTADRLPDSPEFSQASVGTLGAETLTAASMTVTNLLTLPSGSSLRLETVSPSDGTRLSVRKASKGSVRLFGGEPLATEIPRSDGLSSGNVSPEYIDAGSVIFPVGTEKGGLVMATTTAPSWWDKDCAAPGITWAVGPGEITAPVKILLPAKFWFYEFGN